MFGHKYEDALISLRQSRITLLQDEVNRSVYEYISPNDKYYVYVNTCFCSCPSFRRQVVCLNQIRMCKHILATRIAAALKDDKLIAKGFTDNSEMVKIFCNMSHCTTRNPFTWSNKKNKRASGQQTSAETSAESHESAGETSAESVSPDRQQAGHVKSEAVSDPENRQPAASQIGTQDAGKLFGVR